MKIKIFVITHKDFDKPNIENYVDLLVGANQNRGKCRKTFDFYDDTTYDNITLKNKNYCELTGLYWIWKNINADVIGICHYRRYFSSFRYSFSPVGYLSCEAIEKIMMKHDIILPKKFYFSRPMQESFHIAPSIRDMNECKKAIEEIAPEYSGDYQKFLEQNYFFPYNMMITKSVLFNAYCKWIFSILKTVEQNYGVPYTDTYQSRLFGFLSERLLTVWVMHNISDERVYTVPVVKIDENYLTRFYHSCTNMWRKGKFDYLSIFGKHR